MASGPITSWQIDGETMETVRDFIFLGSQITEDGECSHEFKRHLLLGRETMTNLESKKDPSSQGYGVSSSQVWMWELDHKERWVLKNWCFLTVVLEKILESPLDCKEIKSVNPKGNQSWVFFGRTVAEAEAPILWPPDTKSRLTWKDPDAEKDYRQEEKGMTEDEMVGWHHRLDGYEFEQAPGVGDGHGSQRVEHKWATELNWLKVSFV